MQFFVILAKLLIVSGTNGLLFKLQSSGISGHLLNWFSSYLTRRKQRVVLPGVYSSWTTIKAGVPQGSILGPLLFLVYINDIVHNIGANIRLFADDTSLFLVVENPDVAARTLNYDLNTISNWAKKWLVTFNPNKTESILFSKKKVSHNSSAYIHVRTTNSRGPAP